MKKYLRIAVVSLLLTAACSEGTMDYLNQDTANPAVDIVPAKFTLTDAIMNAGFSTVSGDYAFYVSSLTEQEFGTGNNQLKQAELRVKNEWAASSTFNNVWNSTYANVGAIRGMIAKTSEGGLNEGQTDILGMAQTLLALSVGVLTDMHGDIPCTEAGYGSTYLNPSIDKQEDIYYKVILANLDSAIVNLSASSVNNAGSQDILFDGDSESWIGFAYALKARYLLHTYVQDKSALEQVITAGEAAFSKDFVGAEIAVFNGVDCDNPWAAFWWSRAYTGSSTTVLDLMTADNDPRAAIYNVDFFDSNSVGVPGNKEQAGLTESLNAPLWLNNGAATVHLMSLSELHFVLAEAKARLGQDASDNFLKGVDAAFADYKAFGKLYETEYTAYKASKKQEAEAADEVFDPEKIMQYDAFADSLFTDYKVALAQKFNANPLKTIFEQKYLAQARDEQVECYNDIRRCQALGESYITLTNPLNTQGGSNYWPYRLPYGNSSVISNPKVNEAFNNIDIYTDKIWLFGGTK